MSRWGPWGYTGGLTVLDPPAGPTPDDVRLFLVEGHFGSGFKVAAPVPSSTPEGGRGVRNYNRSRRRCVYRSVASIGCSL